MPEDVLDILLTLSNLRGFVAGTREAATSVRSIGTAAREGSAEASTASRRMSGVAGLASKAFKGTAVAAAAFAYESTKMAINFDKQMAMVHTQAGATQAETDRLGKSILQMSATGMYAQGPTELAMGLFHLKSIGLPAARALDALKVAAQGAAVGNASLEDTTTALGSAWLVNMKGAGSLYHTMALLNATVGAGNMRMQQLVESLGTGVLPAAKLAGLGITDVMGALATLTDEGWQGSSAMAQFATSLHFITDPGKKATTALATLGLSATSLANTMRSQGLPAALQLLKSRLDALHDPTRSEQVLGNILPAGRGRVLEVLMNQASRVQQKIHQIQGTTKNFSEDIAATHRTAAFKIHAAWSQIQSDMIRVGHLLEPIAVGAAQAFAKFVTWALKVAPAIGHILPYLVPLIAGFVAYRAAVLAAAAAEIIMSAGGFLAAIISLIPEINSLRDAWILLDLAMDANPIFIVIAAIVAIGVAIYMLVTKVKPVRQFFIMLWHDIEAGAKVAVAGIVIAFNWFKQAATDAVNFVVKHWRLFILVLGPLGLAIDFVTKHWNWFSAAGKAAWSVVSGAASWAWKSVLHPVFNWIAGAASWAVHAIGTVFNTLYKIISAPFSWAWNNVIKPVANWIVGAFRWVAQEITKIFNTIMGPINSVTGTLSSVGGGISHGLGKVANFLGLQSGGTVTSPGMAWVGEHGPELLHLPQGAQVRPLSSPGSPETRSLGATFTFVVPVQINGREVARATGKYVDDRLARQ